MVTSPIAQGALREVPPGWWPVDRLIAGYFALTTALLLVFFSRVPEAWWLLALHAAALAAMVWAIRRQRPGPAVTAFRYWYPLPYVASCYKEMAILIPPIRGVDYDAELARLDRAVWGVNPTVWLERIHSPALTEFLQVAYALFVPAVLLIAWLLWRRRYDVQFRHYAFLIALGFLASYVGYFLVPVRGPRFHLAHLHVDTLRGLWLTPALQHLLDRLESAHYDCFPSGHTELTMLAWWSSRLLSRKLFAAYSLYTAAIVLATVYLRYHYTVDVFAGAMLAAGLLIAAPRLYRHS